MKLRNNVTSHTKSLLHCPRQRETKFADGGAGVRERRPEMGKRRGLRRNDSLPHSDFSSKTLVPALVQELHRSEALCDRVPCLSLFLFAWGTHLVLLRTILSLSHTVFLSHTLFHTLSCSPTQTLLHTHSHTHILNPHFSSHWLYS